MRLFRIAALLLMLAASLPAMAGCSGSFSVSVTRSTPTPTPNPTATAAPTPTPTVVVEATATREERTNEAAEPAPTVVPTPTAMLAPTPTPTPMPVPTATPTPPSCPSADESAYMERLREAESWWVQTTTAFGELAFQLINDPSRFGDQDWNLRVRTVLLTLQGDAQRIREVQPVPASIQHIHTEVEEMAALIDEGVIVFGRGLEDGDPGLVARGNELFQQAAGIRTSVAEALVDLCG
ncbi:MAG: hypothetical protein OXE50_12980 [Chloroflexi bacterium]|nr:hypothetical protein [Chloroflexota bacterium]